MSSDSSSVNAAVLDAAALKKAQRDSLRAAKDAAREAKWARLDSLDAAKAKLAADKKAAKLRAKKLKQLKAINGVIDGYNAQFNCPKNSDLLTKLGEQQMNGKQVQAYGRYRKIDSDFKRTERQREILSKLYEKVTEKSLTELSLLVSRYIDRVDTNLTLTDMISLLPTLLSMKGAQINQLRLPDDGDYQSKTVSGMAVLVPDLQACRDKLSAFLQEQ